MNEMNLEIEFIKDFLYISRNTNGIRPVLFIDAPSTNVYSESKMTGSPTRRELYMEGEPNGSKPTTFTSGAIWAM